MMAIERIVAFCCRWPWAVIAICLLLAGGTGWYTQQNFAMNTDSEQLIDAKVGWRMRQARFDAAQARVIRARNQAQKRHRYDRAHSAR